MKKLPIGIQTFSEIINHNYLYIDKTKEALDLIESDGKYFFLSRPRRFGKSLFIDTLQEIFEGNKHLFEGLYIYDKYGFESYPVIKISWAGRLSTIEDIESVLSDILEENQERLETVCDKSSNRISCFRKLIRYAYEKYQKPVVILIDEYDKPILDVIENPMQAKISREFLKGLYSIIKDSDRYIRFTFLTGVSKFSKASIFSGLNILTDISLNPKYGNICGYTQADIEKAFLPYLEGVDLEKVKAWYNGYNFLKDNVYNPFDILQFIDNGYIFDNYWFETGTPTYLMKLIQKNHYFLPQLANLVVDKKLLSSFDIEQIDVEVLLYQAGYLTIAWMREKRRGGFAYKLKVPNKEVAISLFDRLIDYLAERPYAKSRIQDALYDDLYSGDLEGVKQTLVSLFASIPYNNYSKNPIASYEGYYASVMYAYLQSLGLEIVGEDVTNKGRIDLTVFIENKIYIIEFKVAKEIEVGDNSALAQIKTKNYAQKYLHQSREIYLVGIVFDEGERNVGVFGWERVVYEYV